MCEKEVAEELGIYLLRNSGGALDLSMVATAGLQQRSRAQIFPRARRTSQQPHHPLLWPPQTNWHFAENRQDRSSRKKLNKMSAKKERCWCLREKTTLLVLTFGTYSGTSVILSSVPAHFKTNRPVQLWFCSVQHQPNCLSKNSSWVSSTNT